MTENMNLVEITHLSFSRGERLILDDMNLTLAKGKITAILGPSGTGKTTLLRLIGAQLQPSTGEIRIAGKLMHDLNQAELYQMRRHIGMLFQSAALFTSLSVFENVAFPLREHTNLPEELIRDIVLLKLEAVGLRGARDLMASELSGGMARRVALARAIALDPQLIMYDEPFAGLDPIALGVIVQLIKHLNEALQMTSVLVSHDVEETLKIADYVYIMAGTKIVGQGTPADLLKSDNSYVQQFLQGLPDGAVPFHYPAKSYQEDALGYSV